MLKRLFSKPLFVVFALGVTACGGGSSPSPVALAASNAATNVAPATPTIPVAAAPTTSRIAAINAGGPAANGFTADAGASGGATYGTTATIAVTAANAAPAAVYQTQRYGAMTYTVANLTPGAAYTVRLHFAELYWGLAGRPGNGARIFNVGVNGSPALANLDVVASAGGPNVALVRDLAAVADASGALAIAFTNGAADSPIVNAIEVFGAPATPAAHAARSADAFVDSVGVNVHLSYYGTLYGDDFTRIANLLGALGVRHVRDGLVPGQPNLCAEHRQLAAAGIRLDTITNAAQSTNDFAQWIACTGSAIDAWEGPNEADLSGDSDWAARTRTAQATLAGYARATGGTVLAPAATSASAYAALAPLAGLATNANVHDYFAGRNPGTLGWGGTDAFGTYGSLAWQIGVAQQATGTLPVVSTETGYGDAAADDHWVPADVKMRYTLRTLLEHWNAGVVRTYLYELVDESGPPFSSYGLVTSGGAPKPVYAALKTLLGHLADPGPAFSPAPLAYALAAPANLHQLLLGKRNGSYALVLWIETPEWDPDAHAPIAVAPASVGLSFASAPSSLAALNFDANGVGVAVALPRAAQVTLTVGTTPTVVDVTP